MALPGDDARLRHMLDAARKVRAYSAGHARAALRSPWRAVTGTRDRLIHGYYDVDLGIVGNIIFASVPALIPRLEAILEPPNAPPPISPPS
jgi:uncharacterized protein with HEPN domain